jgi:hypothetical protein
MFEFSISNHLRYLGDPGVYEGDVYILEPQKVEALADL